MKQKAFTLIEMLMVIAVIALLVTVLYPSLGRAREIARHAACRNNLHDVAVGLRLYLNQYSDIMPVAAQMPSQHLNNYPPIAQVLAPYLSDTKTLQCPSDTIDKYYLSEGSSYEYQSIFAGQRVDANFITQRFGEGRTAVMNDYKPFHGQAGMLGASNYLFADGHVGNLE